jgi:hypothetical protein
MNGTRWANGYAFSAQSTFSIVYVCHVIGNGNGFERTFFYAFATTNAGVSARFFGNSTFVLAFASYIHFASLRPFFAQLQQQFGASLGTSSAGGTFIFVYNRQTCGRIYV